MHLDHARVHANLLRNVFAKQISGYNSQFSTGWREWGCAPGSGQWYLAVSKHLILITFSDTRYGHCGVTELHKTLFTNVFYRHSTKDIASSWMGAPLPLHSMLLSSYRPISFEFDNGCVVSDSLSFFGSLYFEINFIWSYFLIQDAEFQFRFAKKAKIVFWFIEFAWLINIGHRRNEYLKRSWKLKSHLHLWQRSLWPVDHGSLFWSCAIWVKSPIFSVGGERCTKLWYVRRKFSCFAWVRSALCSGAQLPAIFYLGQSFPHTV